MKRFAPVLLVLAGWFIAQFAGTPHQVYAQARTSLSSLQAAIDNIINGNTLVNRAFFADLALQADYANQANFASQADLANQANFASQADLANQAFFASQAIYASEAGLAEQARSVPVESGGSSATIAGQLRFIQGTLQVSDGVIWRSLAFENAP